MPKKKSPEQSSPQRRFGAVAFVETIDTEADETEVLSLESLREAFAALDDEERELVDAVPRFARNEEVAEDGENREEPEYDETFQADDVLLPSLEEHFVEVVAPIDDETAVDLNPRSIIEAMLFVGDRDNRPLSAERAAEKMRNVAPEEIDQAVAELNREYHQLGCPYSIIREADGYRMTLRPEFEPVLAKFYGKIREARLSQQAVDTLAVVAYRQPISAEEVQKIRRQPSSALLSQLVRRGLLEVEREVRDKKKIMLYRTTERFLELFQLESIEDLPISEELDFR